MPDGSDGKLFFDRKCVTEGIVYNVDFEIFEVEEM